MFDGINVLAVLAAAGSAFLLGGFWYSKALFGLAWGRAAGLLGPNEAPKEDHRHPARVFGTSFVFALIGAFAFAHYLGPRPDLAHALRGGAIVGGAFVATCFGINYQFADRKFVLWLIDGGYHLAQFLLFGVVLGLWH